MRPFWAASVLLSGFLIAGCAGTPEFSGPASRASLGDFTDHVLDPLALRLADEKIAEAIGQHKVARTPKASTQTLAGFLTELPWIGKLMNATAVSRKAKLDEEVAWLESRRIPLKRELLDLFVSRTTQEGDVFTLCVDGVERRYQAYDITRFSRLPDGPGPCAAVPLISLKRQT